MAASITNIKKVGVYSWLYEWGGTSPYRVFREGVQVVTEDGSTTGRTSYIFENSDAQEPPAIEVFDATETASVAETVTNPPFGIIQWRMVREAEYYRVERYVDAAWALQTTQGENNAGYYQHQTPVLTDVTTDQWRIIPVDASGTQGDPLPVDFFPVRNPDPPSITMTYDDGTGDVTVAAR